MKQIKNKLVLKAIEEYETTYGDMLQETEEREITEQVMTLMHSINNSTAKIEELKLSIKMEEENIMNAQKELRGFD